MTFGWWYTATPAMCTACGGTEREVSALKRRCLPCDGMALPPDPPPPTSPPAIGSYVVDTRSDRLARVTDVRLRRLYLRPPGGGTEWEAMPQHVRPADSREGLRARVAAENARSRARGHR